MKTTQSVKYVQAIAPAAILDAAAATSYVIDTKGWDYASIIVNIGATDVAMAGLKIQEADSSSNSTTLVTASDVTGLVYGTSTLPAEDGGTTSALPTDAADNTLYAFHIDLTKRKRYLQVSLTAGNGLAGTYADAIAILSQGEEMPSTASERGLAANLIA